MRRKKRPPQQGEVAEGWSWLVNGPKRHYFRSGRSLCRKWMVLGQNGYNPTRPEDQKNLGNCRACAERREREIAKLRKTKQAPGA